MDEVLSCRKITKVFPGVTALDEVDFSLQRGEIHALVGENGAGKSTLMNILGGVYQPDSGDLFMDGHRIHMRIPRQAEDLRISVIHQELNLIPVLTVAENVLLAREPTARGPVGRVFGKIQWKTLNTRVQSILDSMDVSIDVKRKVQELPIAQRQLVEVAKALSIDARVLIMDEPTTALSPVEVEHLFGVMRNLRNRGVSVVFISHRLNEVFEIADQISVLRDGKYVATVRTMETTVREVVSLMVGRALLAERSRESQPGCDVLLRVRNLCRQDVLRNISFDLHGGEILGVAGLMGSGRTELARAIFGADRIDKGEIEVRSKAFVARSPAEAIRRGIVLVPEDRKSQGLILNLNVRENISIVILKRLSRLFRIRRSEELLLAQETIRDLRIRCSGPDAKVRNLSGGNQQKTVLGKWLSTDSSVFIFDEPTKGIDVGSKVEIHGLIQEIAKKGAGIILISSELPELFAVTDRILVMREGELAGEFITRDTTQEEIMMAATLGRSGSYGY